MLWCGRTQEDHRSLFPEWQGKGTTELRDDDAGTAGDGRLADSGRL